MSDEPTALDQTEVETPIGEVEKDEPENLDAETEVEGDVEGANEADEDAPEPDPEDELEEFEFDGKKLKGTRGFKESLLRQADYTRKTQETAAKARELEAREAQILQQAAASDEEMKDRAKLISVQEQLKPFADLSDHDWQQWEADDPLAAQQGWRRFQMLKGQHQETVNSLAAKQYERTEVARRQDAERLQQTRRFAETLPGWTPEVGKKIADFAQSEGISLDVLEANITPQFYGILYKAMLGDQAMRKPRQQPKQAATKPLSTVAARTNAPARKSLAEMDMEEYAAARRAGRTS